MVNDIRVELSHFIRDPRLDELKALLDRPNLFYTLKIQGAEIRHSNFIAWLLDPNGNHGIGDKFLRPFLKEILAYKPSCNLDEFDIDLMNLGTTRIRREWQNIDVLIEHEKFAFALENKVWSSEHSNQLARYTETMKRFLPQTLFAMVYLTPFGVLPGSEDDAGRYAVIGYGEIETIAEALLHTYSDSISPRFRVYLEDYIAVIRREILENDKTNALARQIYEAHQGAIEFIIRNKPDRLTEVGELFSKKVESSGWVLGSCDKGYTRFLTLGLSKKIPATGRWRNHEAFLFEFDYWPKRIALKAVVSPGDEENRRILSNALSCIPDIKLPKGEQFLTYYLETKWSFDVTEASHTDSVISKKLDEVWPAIEEFVLKVEAAIIPVLGQLKS